MTTPRRPLDNLPDDPIAIGTQAHAALEEGRLSDAVALYRWALQLARRDADRATEAAALHQLGIVASRLGQHDEAHDLYGQSLAIKRTEGNRAGQSTTLHELGRLALEEGDLDEANGYLDESLAIARSVADPASLIYTLDLQGQLARRRADHAAATEYYNEALDLAEGLGRRDLAAPSAASLGDLAVLAGDWAGAHSHYDLARTYYHAVHDGEGESSVLVSLAMLALRESDIAAAQTAYERVVEQARTAGGAPWAVPAAARALYGLGNIANRKGDYVAAIRYAQQALALARTVNDRRVGGTALASLGMATMNAVAQYPDPDVRSRATLRAFRAWTAALALLEPLQVPETAQYREWIRQAGPVYQEVRARGALDGALAEWWPDA